MQIFLLLSLLISVAFIILSLQNPGIVTVSFIRWSFSGSLAVILLAPFFAGMIAGMFLVLPSWFKRAKSSRMYRKRVQELESGMEKAAANRSGDGPSQP